MDALILIGSKLGLEAGLREILSGSAWQGPPLKAQAWLGLEKNWLVPPLNPTKNEQQLHFEILSNVGPLDDVTTNQVLKTFCFFGSDILFFKKI